MSILTELKEIKNGFMASDRRKAMEAFMSKIYYEIAPCVSFGDTAELFKDESAIKSFCEEKGIDIRAFKWLLDELYNEALLNPSTGSIKLSERGVTALCLDK